MKSTRLLSKSESKHEDLTSKKHAEDKKKNESFRDREWVSSSEPTPRDSVPGLEGPWRGEASGLSYFWLLGDLQRCDPKDIYRERERLRKQHTHYRVAMQRKTKKGIVREAEVRRKLRSPVRTLNVTFAPWTLRALRLAPKWEQDETLGKAFRAATEALDAKGLRPFGCDVHLDTPQAHGSIHMLCLDPQTERMVLMPSQSTWTLASERLRRAGIEHTDEQKRKWLDDNLARNGETADLAAFRAADAVLDAWAKDTGRSEEVAKYLKEYAPWREGRQVKKESKHLIWRLQHLERQARRLGILRGTLVVPALISLAGLQTRNKVEKEKQLERELRNLCSIDRLN